MICRNGATGRVALCQGPDWRGVGWLPAETAGGRTEKPSLFGRNCRFAGEVGLRGPVFAETGLSKFLKNE